MKIILKLSAYITLITILNIFSFASAADDMETDQTEYQKYIDEMRLLAQNISEQGSLYEKGIHINEKTRFLLKNGNTNPYTRLPHTTARTSNPEKVCDLLDTIRKQGQTIMQGDHSEFPARLCFARDAIFAKTGNCGEHADVAMMLAYYAGIPEIYRTYFTTPDHAFLIIGENNHYVLIDPWANAVVSLKFNQPIDKEALFNDPNFFIWTNKIFGMHPDINNLYIVKIQTNNGQETADDVCLKYPPPVYGEDYSDNMEHDIYAPLHVPPKNSDDMQE